MARRKTRFPRGMGSISSEPDERGLYEIRLSLGVEDGKRRRVKRHARSPEEARAILAQLRSEYGIADGLRANGAPPMLGPYLDGWIERKARELAPKTERSYRGAIAHLKTYLGHVRIDRLQADHISRALAAIEQRVAADAAVELERRRRVEAERMAAVKRSGPKRKPREVVVRAYSGARTAQAAYDVLRAALRFAVRERVLTRSPLNAVPRARTSAGEIAFLSRDEALALLEAVSQDRNRCLIHLFIATGLRWSEAVGLRWRDIDLTRAHLTISRQLDRERRVAAALKTTRSRRRIDLPPSVVRELVEQRNAARAAKRDGPDDLVFTTTVGTPLHASNFERRCFFPALKRAGIRRVRVHDLRHTAASLRLLAGANPKSVQEMLGHADVATTLRIYSHVLPTIGVEDALQFDRTMYG